MLKDAVATLQAFATLLDSLHVHFFDFMTELLIT